MSVVETLNKSPVTVSIVAGILILVAGVGVWRTMQASGANTTPTTAQVFYTTDDGKTFFADDASHGMNFSRDGQTAVRAIIFSSAGSRFVGFLERVDPEAQKKIDAMVATHAPGMQYQLDQLRMDGLQVKKPGNGSWVSLRSSEGAKVKQAESPGGGAAEPIAP